MQVVIRPADLERDAMAIVDGARDFVSRVAFQDILPSSDEALIDAVARIVSLDGMEVLLAEHDGDVVGGIGIMYAPYLWNPEIMTADELFWWASPDAPFRTGRLLLDKAVERAGERNAVPVFRALATSPKGVEKVYRRLGLRAVETVYMGAA